MLVQVIKEPPCPRGVQARPTAFPQNHCLGCRLIWLRETYRKVSSLISFDDAFYFYLFLVVHALEQNGNQLY